MAIYSFAQTKSPAEFLGYELGTRFTPHHRIVAYYEHVATQNPQTVKLQYYGETNELRPLLVAFVSSAQHISQMEDIRKDNLARAGILSGGANTRVPILWLSYNVHGNEAVSSEATMQTLWELVNPQNKESKEWLSKSLVVLDPCLNPDGHDRYVNWYNQKMNKHMQPDPQSVEHNEPWPGGRPNHYLFDLNRDWAWQTQKESIARMKLIGQWLPHVHVDFHEQGVNEPYYFAPGAEPLHEQLTAFQRSFQEVIGRNNAKYFDKNNWLYFTKERFDLLYPSYGDTWPMYNGAIGMTYEQGGSGRAGIGVLNALKDTLTLKDRIAHHFTTGMSTLEISSQHADELLDEFEKFYKENSSQPKGKYKSFVVKAGKTPERLERLKALLDKNGIRYESSGVKSGLQGYHYQSGQQKGFATEGGDIVVSAYQPKSVLAQVLFEPEPKLNDSITYDITSWALPYAYGLEAYALDRRLEGTNVQASSKKAASSAIEGKPMAYLVPWHAFNHVQFLTALLRDKIRVRSAHYAFTFGEKEYPAGTLIIMQAGNEGLPDFHQKVQRAADQFHVELTATQSGFVDKGKDFGSPDVHSIKAPRIALLTGSGVASVNFGELWFFLESELDYPLTVLERDQFLQADLAMYDILILPSGNYGAWGSTGSAKIRDWVRTGKKVIAIGSAMDFFANKEGFGLKKFYDEEEEKKAKKLADSLQKANLLTDYQLRERKSISNGVAGAVFEVKLDASYPLSFGIGDKFYVLKNNASHYAYLKDGVNAGVIKNMSAHRSGFVGVNVKNTINSSLALGVEEVGRGQVVYMVDDPIFRNFWEQGKLLLANALFLVD
ncbi:M14 family metallopeptidase [Olivibacter sitiensis]|uniref:M14 family metallopeptidase n=1 Tax=Olivibacter sitiensis TaxID=376470 RepID=UPI00041EAC69|nr:M14 family metallopeptidase [Olivibacter sitiensis]